MNDKDSLTLEIRRLVDVVHDLIDTLETINSLDVHQKKIKIHEEHIPIYETYEKTLLGGLMLDNSNFDAILERVRACHFETQRHRNVFRVMERLHKENKSIDTLSIAEELKAHGDLEIETEKYLFDLAKEVSVKALPHLPFFANMVWCAAKERERKVQEPAVKTENFEKIKAAVKKTVKKRESKSVRKRLAAQKRKKR